MKLEVRELIELINKNTELESSNLFAGANLIITNNRSINDKTQDVIVYSEYAENLSWLVFELKKIFHKELNSFNKYIFYTRIGKLMNEAIEKDLDLRHQMLFVLENLGDF